MNKEIMAKVDELKAKSTKLLKELQQLNDYAKSAANSQPQKDKAIGRARQVVADINQLFAQIKKEVKKEAKNE